MGGWFGTPRLIQKSGLGASPKPAVSVWPVTDAGSSMSRV